MPHNPLKINSFLTRKGSKICHFTALRNNTFDLIFFSD
ncbi:hypothetical protein GAGA_1914 [Paraglaciecola agarilytica NO2]|uniref:Uncharacterized protein n=1 Tax=Paraglaciecola agarilytica NO2 TaxID=1125747 RepID=A0ABQ0I6S7_9ALTE|nr:hypothetical protein GAGA_1914 [Paraglaciecola agarilytica NO2]